MDSSTTTSASSASSSSALDLPIFGDVSELGGVAGSKRRRMSAKAKDPFAVGDELPAAQPDSIEATDEHAEVDLPGDPEVWKRKSTREKRMFIGDRLRRMKWYEKFQTSTNRKSHRTRVWPSTWTDLNDAWKQKFVKWWALHPDNTCGPAEKDWAVANFVNEQNQAEDESKGRKHRHRLKQVLLTYNGQWGDISWQTAIPKTSDMSELTATLRKSKFC